MPIPTHDNYDKIAAECRSLMAAKNSDYGDSYALFRMESFVDQIHVKVHRMIELQTLAAQGKSPKVSEGIRSEFMDICNYAILAITVLDGLTQGYSVEPTQNSKEHGFFSPDNPANSVFNSVELG